ncbi:MAG TPA: hypothetical protein VGN23_06020 [Verrucomicrobiae bacterium]|jgi:hypothetical protein
MISNERNKPYAVGLSIGTRWLIAASTGFAIYLLSMAGMTHAGPALIAVLLVAGTLLVASARQLVAALKLPNESRAAEGRDSQF